MARTARFTDIDGYLATLPEAARDAVQTIRQRVGAAIPSARETIAYNMPAFRDGRILFYFGGFRSHVGIYPPLTGDDLVPRLAPYRGPNGNLKFPLGPDLPYDLIITTAQALWRQYGPQDRTLT